MNEDALATVKNLIVDDMKQLGTISYIESWETMSNVEFLKTYKSLYKKHNGKLFVSEETIKKIGEIVDDLNKQQDPDMEDLRRQLINLESASDDHYRDEIRQLMSEYPKGKCCDAMYAALDAMGNAVNALLIFMTFDNNQDIDVAKRYVVQVERLKRLMEEEGVCKTA